MSKVQGSVIVEKTRVKARTEVVRFELGGSDGLRDFCCN